MLSPNAVRREESSEVGNWEPFGRARWRGSDIVVVGWEEVVMESRGGAAAEGRCGLHPAADTHGCVVQRRTSCCSSLAFEAGMHEGGCSVPVDS